MVTVPDVSVAEADPLATEVNELLPEKDESLNELTDELLEDPPKDAVESTLVVDEELPQRIPRSIPRPRPSKSHGVVVGEVLLLVSDDAVVGVEGGEVMVEESDELAEVGVPVSDVDDPESVVEVLTGGDVGETSEVEAGVLVGVDVIGSELPGGKQTVSPRRSIDIMPSQDWVVEVEEVDEESDVVS